MRYYLAVDIGASSGRHILGHVEHGKIVLEEVYRFSNRMVPKNGHQCWELDRLYQNILEGLKACKAAGKIPETMGIDTWAIDFVLLSGNGDVLGDTVAYRDSRTEGMRQLVERRLPFDEHYAITGIQYQPFNTVYQLMALKQQHPEQLEQAERFLMVPEYFNYRLTGKQMNEYTNATSTALVDARSKQWSTEILKRLELPEKLFAPLHLPGTVVGNFTSEVRNEVGFDCRVILPATHDTGSAYLAVPARDDAAVYLSSGTWSLLGVENRKPVTTPKSRKLNFTNEGGYEYRYRFLKNIMGLWMIQSIRHDYGDQYSYAELEQMAREASSFESLVNVDNERFLAPKNMVAEVQNACRESGQTVPQTPGEVMQCVYRSLAGAYARTIRQLENLTGKQYTSLNIVGGGSKDGYLNELTARASGLPVFAGPTEGTALGNLMVQMLFTGEYDNLTAARRAVKESFSIKEVQP